MYSLVTDIQSDLRDTAHNTAAQNWSDGSLVWSLVRSPYLKVTKLWYLDSCQHHESVTQSFGVLEILVLSISVENLDQNPKNTYQWSQYWGSLDCAPWTRDQKKMMMMTMTWLDWIQVETDLSGRSSDIYMQTFWEWKWLHRISFIGALWQIRSSQHHLSWSWE